MPPIFFEPLKSTPILSWAPCMGTDHEGSAFVILDMATGSYLVVEPIDPKPDEIATNIAELLDWVYDRYVLNV